VANKIISAPFAIIGSIGVVAQLPNFNKLLKKHDVEIEQHTAGNYKRTLTMLGENTDEAREKFKEELADTHILFKEFVSEYRPELDIEKVATGEHWYGKQALELKLVDELLTSDDFVLNSVKDHTLYKVEYKIKQKLAEKLGIAAAAGASSMFSKMSAWSFTSNK
jgi:serine protease SohB